MQWCRFAMIQVGRQCGHCAKSQHCHLLQSDLSAALRAEYGVDSSRESMLAGRQLHMLIVPTAAMSMCRLVASGQWLHGPHAA